IEVPKMFYRHAGGSLQRHPGIIAVAHDDIVAITRLRISEFAADDVLLHRFETVLFFAVGPNEQAVIEFADFFFAHFLLRRHHLGPDRSGESRRTGKVQRDAHVVIVFFGSFGWAVIDALGYVDAVAFFENVAAVAF